MECKIIEFIGTPGSGKSTICLKVYEKLRKNYNVLNFSYELGKKKKKERILKKALLSLYFIFRDFRLAIKISLMSLELPNKKEGIKILFNFLYLYGLLEKEKLKYDYILLDQGIIQGMWSYFISLEKYSEVLIENWLDILKITKYDCMAVRIEASDTNIIKRLNERAGKQSRFEKIDDVMLLKKKVTESALLLNNLYFKLKIEKITLNNDRLDLLGMELKTLIKRLSLGEKNEN